MSVIDILTRVDSICKKYDKYDIDNQKDLNVSGDDAFVRLFAAVETEIETTLQKAEDASNEKNKADAVAINAEIRRTKARLLEEVPKLQRLAIEKVNMIGSSFLDEMNFDISGDFFDHIDDLLDFPIEEIEGGNGFQDLWDTMPPPEGLVGPCSDFSNTSCSEVPLPDEDIAQLEWLSTFVEDSFSAGSINLKPNFSNNNKKENSGRLFRTSSPVSVLESSSSCSGKKRVPLSSDTVVPTRARSKRPRPTTFNPRSSLNLVSPISSITNSISDFSSELENFGESYPLFIPKPDGTEQKKKMKKEKKLSLSLPPSSLEQSVSLQQQTAVAVRKCLHCGITKTPQWRAGPMGPKTLCNACGVRHKSGRLFPEYRPAASPTFVASVHSNSHRKVLEMRIQAGYNIRATETMNQINPGPELIPASNQLLDCM